ncbi:MAG: site-specific DNA-methyltransferase, partial [Polyangiaceae bacterium]
DLLTVERVEPAWGEDPKGQGHLPLRPAEGQWRNKLIRGDNLLAMQALLSELEGKLRLVYIDPPYATGLSYYTLASIGDAQLERRAYRDQQAGGLVGYLEQMQPRLLAIHRLLADDGALFLHCDWRANSALRLLLDEIFGPECFRNEIIWRRAPNLGRQAASKQLGRVIDTIFVYTKAPGAGFPGPVPRRRTLVPTDRKGKPKGTKWDEDRELYFTTAPRGDYTDKSIAELRKQGRVYDSSTGTVYIKYFLTKGEDGRWYKEQPVDALWDDFEVRPLRHRPKAEDMGYDTQKPEGLLERIVGWASAPGDIVADFFGGSGTTAAVAERLGRRWISTDVGHAAIAIQRRRLLDLRKDGGRVAEPFDVCSVERAQRRRWAASLEDPVPTSEASANPSDPDAAHVLELFGAQPVEGRYGVSGDTRVVVAPVDGPVTEAFLDRACADAKKAGHPRVVILGFEWSAGDAAAIRARLAARHDVTPILRTIPPEATARRTRGDLRFPERPEVEVELVPRQDARRLSVQLTELRCSTAHLDGAPDWRDLVDAWMVDWDANGAFEPTWRSYRTPQSPELAFETPAHDFSPREVTAVRVRVITVFGDEVERQLRVEI